MTKYNWERMYKNERGVKGKHGLRIHLSERGMLTISKSVDDYMGNPEYVEVFFDKKSNAIGLEPQENESDYAFKVTRRTSGNPVISGKKLTMHMPIGKYDYEHDLHEAKHIFTWSRQI